MAPYGQPRYGMALDCLRVAAKAACFLQRDVKSAQHKACKISFAYCYCLPAFDWGKNACRWCVAEEATTASAVSIVREKTGSPHLLPPASLFDLGLLVFFILVLSPELLPSTYIVPIEGSIIFN